MTKELSKPDAEYLAALGAASSSIASTAGQTLLLFRQGIWQFGVDQEEIEEGSVLVLDPRSFKTGFVAWHMREIEGEVMYPVDQVPRNIRDQLHEVKAKDGWQPQLACAFRFPDDQETILLYKTTSMGGFDAMRGIMQTVAKDMHPPEKTYPKVKFGVDSYEHKEYGLTYKPTLKVVGWLPANFDGDTKAVPAPVKRSSDLL